MKQKNLVLMVVAVGCGLVAAFLTSQMSAKGQVETVDVVVAAKDLPVGVQITKDDLPKLVKRKRVPKDGLPPDIVENEEELADRRLSRPIRAEETINKKDLLKGGIVTIPPGMHLLTLQLDTARAAAGFAGPGSRVDILASIRLGDKLTAMPILVDMLILAVNGQTTIDEKGAFQGVNTVSFAADRKQGLVLELAKARGCPMSLLLRHPDAKDTENDRNYDIDRMIKLLGDEKNPIEIAGADQTAKKDEKDPQPETPAPPAVEVVKVPYALVDVKAGTEITTDLIADDTVFGIRELPKHVAEDAVTDLTPMVGQVFRTGLGKGQWVTKSLVGPQEPKAPPRESFVPEKADPAVPPPAATNPTPEPVKPAGPPRKTHDVTIHTGTETKTYRYEEVAPGRWQLLGEVKPGRKPKAAEPAAEGEPKPEPESKPATPADPNKKYD